MISWSDNTADITPSVSSVENREIDFSSGFLCSICQETFDDPKILPNCGHSFCQKCLPRLVNSRSCIVCFECKTISRTNFSDLKTNKALAKIIDLLNTSDIHLGDRNGFDVIAMNSELVHLRADLQSRNEDVVRLTLHTQEVAAELEKTKEQCADLISEKTLLTENEEEQKKSDKDDAHRSYIRRLSDYYQRKIQELENDLKERDSLLLKQGELITVIQKTADCQEESYHKISNHLTSLNDKVSGMEKSFGPANPEKRNAEKPKQVDDVLQLLSDAKSGLDDFFKQNVSTFQQDLIDTRLANRKLEEEVAENRELIRKLLYRLRTASMECIVLLRQFSEKIVNKATVSEESEGETVAKRLRRGVLNKKD